jgi:hypothetical protein
MDSSRLRRTLEQLLDAQRDDARLRDHLEGLQRDEAFPGLTWYWGPRLYERNRAMFRPFILTHFSDWERGRLQWRRIKWSDHERSLEAWLAAARTSRDTALVRRLLRWKYAGDNWGIDPKQWNAALLRAYQAASGPAARAVALDEFDDWFELDEDTALSLHASGRASRDFILKHLPRTFWGGEKRKLWTRLYEAAAAAGDEKLQFALYRRQKPINEWSAEVLALATQIPDSQQLNEELLRRHPEGFDLKLGDTFVKLLQARGRDVMPYVQEKLKEVYGGWYGSKPEPLVALAESRGWWDLWAEVIRTGSDDKLFNKHVGQLLVVSKVPEADRLSRLAALAGVSREWNWPGFGLARVHALNDELAATMYRRYPHLIHGAFRPHVTPTWWQGYPKLLQAGQEAGDEDLIDLLASRYVTRVRYGWGGAKDLLATADRLATDYQALRDRDPMAFARRAANVLTRIPAYSISGYTQLLRTNSLARLLLVRSFDAFLSVPEAVQDLVEGSDIHVQMLAYRVLAQDDHRARRLAVHSLDILMGTLWRPLHRKTRLAAFEALANAARADAEAGRIILHRSRQALRLPDKKYPKEQLIGLIGRVLDARPELRGEREQPVIYRRQEQTA